MALSTIPKTVGFIYALVMIVVIAFLWYSGGWNKKIGWLVLIISSALGFLIFSPVAPYQFQQLVLGNPDNLGTPLIVGFIGLCRLCSCSLCYRAGFSADISAR